MTVEPGDHSFPPAARFHDGRDFGRVFHRQQKRAGPEVVVLVAPARRPPGAGAGPPRSRLGLMVSTKVSKSAVRRHQLKRWIREWFRTVFQHRHQGLDMVVLLRQDPPDDHPRFVQQLERVAAQAVTAEARPGSGPGPRKGRR